MLSSDQNPNPRFAQKSMYRPINKGLLNLLPVSPFCFAFPFGTVARMKEEKDDK